MTDCLQEQSEADKARLKAQLEADLEANRRQREKVQAEKAKVEAALEMLEMENKCRAEAIRNTQAAAAKAMAQAAAVEAAKKKDLILQLRHVKLQPAVATWCSSGGSDLVMSSGCNVADTQQHQIPLDPCSRHHRFLNACKAHQGIPTFMHLLNADLCADAVGRWRRHLARARCLTLQRAGATTCWRRCPC